MSMTQFAMIEELAFLVKDNLPSKHLVLSMEEALVNFLQDETSPNGVLELIPMSPYNRLLLHRLADIFGFAHESVGEGDDRHLILERCPESSIPAILVSDILWQCDEYPSPTASHQLLKRTEDLPALKTNPASFQSSLEEREAAYVAARERIFSIDEIEIKESIKEKPRTVPVVARRMIAHALGQRLNSSNVKNILLNSEEYKGKIKNSSEKNKINTGPSVEASPMEREKKVHGKVRERKLVSDGSPSRVVSKKDMKEENLGAAKRMFAQALGLNSPKDNHGILLKCTEPKPTYRK